MDDIYNEANVSKWYEEFRNEEFDDLKLIVENDELISLRIEAQNVLENESKIYHSRQGKGGNNRNVSWVKKIMSKGTAKDKVAAYVLTIQNSPIHNINHISSLINMVKVSKKKECILIMETLADLFLEDLLIPNKKLKSFDKQPLSKLNELTSGCAQARKKRLLAWIFEEKLKELFDQFVCAIDTIAKDTIEANRIKAVSILFKLLSCHPEKEQILLQNLINKLGDPSQKVVAKVIYCLTMLLRVHPNMKQVVLNEVEKLLFRPNVNFRTQYYCICFLSQFIFNDNDANIARNVINIYFSFFKASIKKGEVDSRLMGALLMGVKRAYPFADIKDGSMSQHIDTLYKLVHLTTFNISVHALCLLQQISDSNNDRFYGALYRKILDPKLSASCHHAVFINLLYKALSVDQNTSRIIAFIKRLFQICFYVPVPLTCGILYLISQLMSAGGKELYASVLQQKDDCLDNFSSDEEEKYIDIEEQQEKDKDFSNFHKNEKKTSAGWAYSEFNIRKGIRTSGSYNPLARNPAFASADKSIYFELTQLSQHFHPTVALFASKLLKREPIVYDGDPLADFTINRFLERFVFKNPKNTRSVDGMTKGPDPQLAPRKYYIPPGVKALHVTSDRYLDQSECQIPVDELFVYKYLKVKHEKRSANKSNSDDDDDLESVASEEFEEMIDNMTRTKKEKMDFFNDIGQNLIKKTKGKTELLSEDEMEDDEYSDLSDDKEVMEFSSDSDFDNDRTFNQTKNEKSHSVKKGDRKKKMENNFNNLFAPAEEFSEILEEAGSAVHKHGMINSVENKDNAAPKQLDWEKKRENWRKNRSKKTKRKIQNSSKFAKRQKK
ncbi:CCAAT/enhancer-binding protein zeta-like [Cimex lectularius]|uniref:CCAAT-binding factor domain-containing protein n=1 Tax=Cimex lectularius TaxID=79782 RepID=A0A8I6RY24_CIMLE|nr:CCAAT/enhancer-binding protein zeta-like [Cimex lectularius]